MVGVLLRMQGSTILTVKVFGSAVLEKAASSNPGGHAVGPVQTGMFGSGPVTSFSLQWLPGNWSLTRNRNVKKRFPKMSNCSLK